MVLRHAQARRAVNVGYPRRKRRTRSILGVIGMQEPGSSSPKPRLSQGERAASVSPDRSGSLRRSAFGDLRVGEKHAKQRLWQYHSHLTSRRTMGSSHSHQHHDDHAVAIDEDEKANVKSAFHCSFHHSRAFYLFLAQCLGFSVV
jgi:hypothetical protein